MRKAAVIAVGCLLLLSARHRAITPPKQIAIDIRRSMVITDPAILDAFDFHRVLQTLTDRSGTTTTPLALYRQWFDTQNPKPGLAVADAPHCDDFLTDGKPSFNGFPRRCPTPEGILATTDPFTAHDYIPIGITNRFDLTPADGANCGQYRLIYAKVVSSPANKLHIIFEGILPNPNPAAGAQGCRPVAQFWADLSGVDSLAERRARLERFFFDGIDGFAPMLHPNHFAPETGRIRTWQADPTTIARFYQFHLQKSGTRLLVVPGLLENLPFGALYNSAVPTELGAEFRQFFISQVATLAIRDVNGFFDRIPDKYLMAESHPQASPLAFDSGSAVNQGGGTPEGQAFRTAIEAELKRAGSSLTIGQLMTRADLQNCHGCHLGGPGIGDGLIFPPSLGGTHVDESKEMVGGVMSFRISPALRDVFAPNRVKILRDFLAGAPLPAHSN